MIIVIEYRTPKGETGLRWMGLEQTLRFGRTSRADVAIESDPSLADIHFAVTGIDGDWYVSALNSHHGIFVNGQLVSRRVLEHDDEVQAGQTTFRISIEGKAVAPRSEIAEVHRPEPVIESQPVAFSVQQYPSKVAEFSIQVQDWQVAELLHKFVSLRPWSDYHVYLVLNGKRFGKTPTTWSPGDKDLFEHAPDEIRATDSLSVSALDKSLTPEILAEFQRASRADAACMIFSPLNLDALLESHKVVWAWFSRPSTLAIQLSRGSSVLAEKLLLDGELAMSFGTQPNSGLKLLIQVAQREKLQSVFEPMQLRILQN
jgi:pSer/pThr/pTyr-binding forkhead associated (FHA) protein